MMIGFASIGMIHHPLMDAGLLLHSGQIALALVWRHGAADFKEVFEHFGDPIRPHSPESDGDHGLGFSLHNAAPNPLLEAWRQGGRYLPLIQQSAKRLLFMAWFVDIHWLGSMGGEVSRRPS